MGKKVLVTSSRFHDEAERILHDAGLEVAYCKEPAEEELCGLIGSFDACIAGSHRITGRALALAPKLRLIARVGVGYDGVDWTSARERGIAVTITPGANEQSVADLAFGLLLALARRIPAVDRIVRQGGWGAAGPGVEVWGKRIGIVGTGRIGKAMARRAAGFDMTVLAYDPFPDMSWAQASGARYAALDELLAEADAVTLHVPLMERTRHLVDRRFLAAMKRSAFLIQTSRGGVVDEGALADALESGRIAGAALDVFEREPIDPAHPLLRLDNCLFSSHEASHTEEAIRRMCVMSAEEVVRAMAGLAPLHPIPEWRQT